MSCMKRSGRIADDLDKLLIFHMDGSDNQFIAAIEKIQEKSPENKRSGKMHDNPQLKKAYGTPVIAKIRGRDVVVSPAATGFMATIRRRARSFGRWNTDRWDFRSCPSR